MSKVLLETIQVTRHLSSLGLRPVRKVVLRAAQATEDAGVWTMKLEPVQSVVGRERSEAVLDSYFQGKQVMDEAIDAWQHQSFAAALQTAAHYSTQAMRHMGVEGRVVGPLDPHWNTLKVIKDLRKAESERISNSKKNKQVALTPKRFVKFMREAERKRKASLNRDPIDQYVEYMLRNGNLSSMGPRYFEKKMYTDVARILCFAFDRVLKDIDGANFWGHALQVKTHIQPQPAETRSTSSGVGVEQVAFLVDQMLMKDELQVPAFMDGIQRQLLMNCTFMLLQLIEDLTSPQHLGVTVLGHSLRVSIEALPMGEVWDEEVAASRAQRFQINKVAVDEFVAAMIEDPEVQSVLVPDIVEAEVYRYGLHRMVCIIEFVLSHLEICLFGNEVHLYLESNEGARTSQDNFSLNASELNVEKDELTTLIARLKEETQRIEQELRRRQDGETAATETPEVDDNAHEFETMAAQDRLARNLCVHRTVEVPIQVAYSMVADVAEYPKWMPFCTASAVINPPLSDKSFACEVGFGLETGTALGAVGDTIRYRVTASPPSGAVGSRVGRVVADTPDGFRYGKRLVYDWRFTEVGDGETDVKLDMFFQAGTVFFLPLWDSMQATITSAMMQKFAERAEFLKGSSGKGAASKPQSTAGATAAEQKRNDDQQPAADASSPPAQDKQQ